MEWYRLRLAGVKDGVIKKLLKLFKNYEDIFQFERYYFEKNLKLEDEVIEKIFLSKNLDIEKEREKLNNLGIGILFINDENYPENLKNISSPPLFLYYKGDLKLLNKNKVGIVGTRKATSYGKISCEKLTKDLVKNKVVTVSGLALGIDTVCHKSTLEGDGKTIAVVGSGLDVIYPRENERLWKQIGEKGLLISEYPLGTEPLKFNFPRRNRIIVGISNGIIVVESQKTGGSLITAELALDEGREVYAIPGDIFSFSSEGCNNLIKNSQAKLITSADDIMEDMGWTKEGNEEKDSLALSDYERKIYNVLTREKSLDEIIMETSLKVGEALAILMELEYKKIIVSIAGGKYRRKN